MLRIAVTEVREVVSSHVVSFLDLVFIELEDVALVIQILEGVGSVSRQQ